MPKQEEKSLYDLRNGMDGFFELGELVSQDRKMRYMSFGRYCTEEEAKGALKLLKQKYPKNHYTLPTLMDAPKIVLITHMIVNSRCVGICYKKDNPNKDKDHMPWSFWYETYI